MHHEGRSLEPLWIWLYSRNASLDAAAKFFGAPVTEEEACPAEHVFDHVVESEPPQRIPAGEIVTVRAAHGTYKVAWSRAKPDAAAIACNPYLYEQNNLYASFVGE